MWINNKPLYLFGGKLRMDYSYTSPELENEYFQGRNRSGFTLLANNYNLGTLTLPIVFEGKDSHDAALKKSKFENEAFGRSDIIIGDGFMYFAFLESIGEASFPSGQLIEVTYVFKGIRHGRYREVKKNTVYCESTLPRTDCILEVTVGQNGKNYKVGTVAFPDVIQGQLIKVDGINKRILINGKNSAEKADWVTMPALVPGRNYFECKDTLTIGYYPVYF
ncbi:MULTISPECIES: hypothetical protein [Clostridia]|uniref:hypothetical protein n=1 Tax=Clostridia TaxID=186801 RepID=UPI00067EE39F|nr:MULTISPECIES: hypothetical protein [Clostridia]